jgi:hypothetical protein
MEIAIDIVLHQYYNLVVAEGGDGQRTPGVNPKPKT